MQFDPNLPALSERGLELHLLARVELGHPGFGDAAGAEAGRKRADALFHAEFAVRAGSAR